MQYLTQKSENSHTCCLFGIVEKKFVSNSNFDFLQCEEKHVRFFVYSGKLKFDFLFTLSFSQQLLDILTVQASWKNWKNILAYLTNWIIKCINVQWDLKYYSFIISLICWFFKSRKIYKAKFPYVRPKNPCALLPVGGSYNFKRDLLKFIFFFVLNIVDRW